MESAATLEFDVDEENDVDDEDDEADDEDELPCPMIPLLLISFLLPNPSNNLNCSYEFDEDEEDDEDDLFRHCR